MIKIILIKLFLVTVTITKCYCNIDNDVLEKYAIFPHLPPIIESSDNAVCTEHNRIYRENLDNFTLWAFEMWDSTTKGTTGVLKGNSFHMGHFEECLTVQAPFPTQYCLVTLEAIIPDPNRDDPYSLYHDPNEVVLQRLYPYRDKSQWPRNTAKMGWCTPASCKPEDLKMSLNNYMTYSEASFIKRNKINFTVSLTNVDCQSYQDRQTFDAADISFCILAISLIITVIVATVLDVNPVKEAAKSHLPRKILLAFSVKANIRSLFKIEQRNPALGVLHGVRIIAIIGIIIGHRFGFFVASTIMNPDYVESQFRTFSNAILFRVDLFVDSFFLLSGILVTYGLLSQFEKKRINAGLIIFVRYIRLTPALAFVVFFYATLFNYTGSGPLWKAITRERDHCRASWWTNLLYINNYVNLTSICVIQSWYLPCDFHYFIIAIGICLLIGKNRKYGLFTLFFITLISIIIPFVITVIYELPGLMVFYQEAMKSPLEDRPFKMIYTKSHTRATPYFIGIIAGYIYYRFKDKNKYVNKVHSYIILAISVMIIFASFIGSLIFYNPYHHYNKYESAIYAALDRPAFALGSVGILYVASYGNCGFIYKILSWNIWIPLGRLVYCVYLVHVGIQYYTLATFESSRMFNYVHLVIWCVSDFVLSLMIALILYLMIEAPFMRICKELLPKPKANQDKSNSRLDRNEILLSSPVTG